MTREKITIDAVLSFPISDDDLDALQIARADLYQLFLNSIERGDVCRCLGFEDGARCMHKHLKEKENTDV